MPRLIDLDQKARDVVVPVSDRVTARGPGHDEYLIDYAPIGTTRFLGLDFHQVDEDQVVALIGDWAKRDRFAYVVTPNVAHAVWFDREQQTGSKAALAYRSADLTVCDSRIIGLLARRSGMDIPLVTGSDLTKRLLKEGGSWSRLAVVGGTPEMHAGLRRKFPQYTWLFHEPPHGLINDPAARARIAEFVERSQADVTFFAVGAPQSELCCYEIAQRGSAKGVGLCIGASLEFLTGIQRRAPRWMQRGHLEWLHRLLSDPGRMWKRYMVESPKIFRIWLRDKAIQRSREAN